MQDVDILSMVQSYHEIKFLQGLADVKVKKCYQSSLWGGILSKSLSCYLLNLHSEKYVGYINIRYVDVIQFHFYALQLLLIRMTTKLMLH